jgi:hypothetical protein
MKLTNFSNKWKDTLCSWIGRLNMDKIEVLPKLVCRFNAISTKSPSPSPPARNNQIVSKIHMEVQGKKKKIERLTLVNFKTYCKVTVIKTVCGTGLKTGIVCVCV